MLGVMCGNAHGIGMGVDLGCWWSTQVGTGASCAAEDGVGFCWKIRVVSSSVYYVFYISGSELLFLIIVKLDLRLSMHYH